MLRVALIRSNASPSPTPDATSARWKTLWERHPPSPYWLSSFRPAGKFIRRPKFKRKLGRVWMSIVVSTAFRLRWSFGGGKLGCWMLAVTTADGKSHPTERWPSANWKRKMPDRSTAPLSTPEGLCWLESTWTSPFRFWLCQSTSSSAQPIRLCPSDRRLFSNARCNRMGRQPRSAGLATAYRSTRAPPDWAFFQVDLSRSITSSRKILERILAGLSAIRPLTTLPGQPLCSWRILSIPT